MILMRHSSVETPRKPNRNTSRPSPRLHIPPGPAGNTSYPARRNLSPLPSLASPYRARVFHVPSAPESTRFAGRYPSRSPECRRPSSQRYRAGEDLGRMYRVSSWFPRCGHAKCLFFSAGRTCPLGWVSFCPSRRWLARQWCPSGHLQDAVYKTDGK